MKRTRIRRVSEKQKAELSLRKKIKAELIFEQIKAVGFVYCVECKGKPSWEGIDLSHKIPLSRGGKTEIENCQILCRVCHNKRHSIHLTTNT